MVRRTGASFFALELSWSAAEPAPRRVPRGGDHAHGAAAAPVGRHAPPRPAARDREPRATCRRIWRTSRSTIRSCRCAWAASSTRCTPALLDFQIALARRAAPTPTSPTSPTSCAPTGGSSTAPSSFSRRSCRACSSASTTAAPTESPAPEVAAALHQREPAPALHLLRRSSRGAPFEQRDPDVLEKDWRALLEGARGTADRVSASSATPPRPRTARAPSSRPSSSAASGASSNRADGRALLFARYVALRDEPARRASRGADAAPVAAEAAPGVSRATAGSRSSTGRRSRPGASGLRESAGCEKMMRNGGSMVPRVTRRPAVSA